MTDEKLCSVFITRQLGERIISKQKLEKTERMRPLFSYICDSNEQTVVLTVLMDMGKSYFLLRGCHSSKSDVILKKKSCFKKLCFKFQQFREQKENAVKAIFIIQLNINGLHNES